MKARRKGEPRKVELAWELRSRTTMPLAWIAERLNLGRADKPPEPDRFYAENLAAKNYYMGKEEPPPYGSRSRREEANPSPSAPGTPLTAPGHRADVAAAGKE
ncbi:MAG: hypothetical protein WCK27_32890, partial [Verrucomicrobiota bacterium]